MGEEVGDSEEGGGQGGSGRGGYIITIKVFKKHKILSIETILSA